MAIAEEMLYGDKNTFFSFEKTVLNKSKANSLLPLTVLFGFWQKEERNKKVRIKVNEKSLGFIKQK